MSFNEIFLVLEWWFYIFLVGVVFLPLTNRVFSVFPDKGYAFSKTLGVVVISYFVFLVGIFHLVPFSRILVLILILASFLLQFIRYGRSSYLYILKIKRFLLVEELLFLSGLFLWSYVRGFAPEIHGLEKFMDYGFINSILRSEYFPPKDMWLTPSSINYYYFGHLVTAVLTKASAIPSSITYNLMLSSIVGLTLSSSFSIGATLFLDSLGKFKKSFLKIFVAGILTAFLVTFSGNIHTIYTFFKPYENEKPVPFWQLQFTGVNPCYKKQNYLIQSNGKETKIDCSDEEQKLFSLFPNSYWYPNATRFIHNTIHEFPIYSWVVADLHGHVLDIPFVLLTIGFALSIYLSALRAKENEDYATPSFFRRMGIDFTFPPGSLMFAGFLLAVMYMTNAWDGIIYFLLYVFLFLVLLWEKESQQKIIKKAIAIFPVFFLSCAILFFVFIIFSLPFSVFFKPFASGIGILCAPDFLVKIKTFGPLLFEANHCQKSPIWQLFILYGFFYFFVISFLVFLQRTKKIIAADGFVLILIMLGSILIVVPEFIYLKDIYPEHYRANTMFKLVFQSFIILSLASGYVIARITSYYKIRASSLKFKMAFVSWMICTLILLSVVFIYPFQATYSYYGNLINYKGLNGTNYLKESYPSDFEAIEWLNMNIKGQPVILEAQGDSYTDYARVSSNTGLPTVLGWTVHEWLWRGSYDIPAPRISEIQTIYESNDLNKIRGLLNKYKISYVFVGDLEREKYSEIDYKKFSNFGKVIYRNGKTVIYKLN